MFILRSANRYPRSLFQYNGDCPTVTPTAATIAAQCQRLTKRACGEVSHTRVLTVDVSTNLAHLVAAPILTYADLVFVQWQRLMDKKYLRCYF